MALNRRSFVLGTSLTLLGLTGHAKSVLGDSPETPRSCRPKDALSALQAGNARFVEAWQNKNRAATTAARAAAMANLWRDTCFLPADVISRGQAPWATILTCADSRVAPEWIFDAAPSDLFVIRSAGNTAFDEAIASMEYSVSNLGCPLIMVMGHSSCGAVEAARRHEPLTPLLEQLVEPIRDSLQPDHNLMESIQANARRTSSRLTQRSELLAMAHIENRLTIVSSYFDIVTGRVSLL